MVLAEGFWGIGGPPSESTFGESVSEAEGKREALCSGEKT